MLATNGRIVRAIEPRLPCRSLDLLLPLRIVLPRSVRGRRSAFVVPPGECRSLVIRSLLHVSPHAFPRIVRILCKKVPRAARHARLSRTFIDGVDRYFHCTTVGMQGRRSLTYALMAAVAAVMGLLLLRAPFRSGPLAADFLSNRYEFIYLFAAIAFTFLAVGYVLGRQADNLRRLSSTDVLTGLSNRRALDQHLRDECARAARYRSPLALLLIDLDGLKQVNDVWGHAAGDDLLHRTGIAIQQSLRGSDAGARWGGDEFAIVAPETSREAAMRLADRLRAQLKDGAGGDRQRAISASIGIAIFDPDRNDRSGPEALMRAADEALYAAKAGGRDQVKVA